MTNLIGVFLTEKGSDFVANFTSTAYKEFVAERCFPES